ncbi:DNA adenine methylase [Rhodopseudomonas palustris]|uniref:Site-specific DNA-methyltransferase (adenine-specific) n=1 Tax=Thiospirillum jenense TaxID=1653858 RepID=A0A839H7Z8_9GAMM|nr:Dam family site-specific DNA-(adenine-N6)-methyltransferase [Thiospirillum jenense]MBB1089690.1 DNA adenine methylase [Rhodopseudomonas palustris]MBB1124790.1 DNA adenine methylase [Thiospirillum jenense]
MLVLTNNHQLELLTDDIAPVPKLGKIKPFRTQLLKWIGNKQQQADLIISFFPKQFNTYFEPFLGSGGVLGVLAPKKAVASDTFAPLIQIWQTLHNHKELLKKQYAERYALIAQLGKKTAYESVRANYNRIPNGADLLYLCRACYGGVVRFRKNDGYMSTPVGIHDPITPDSFNKRVDIWHIRTQGACFLHLDFAEAMKQAKEGDLVYCDPPYSDSQAILYGAQTFSLQRLFNSIAACKARGVFVVLSIDGTKYSGRKLCNIAIPNGLFEREAFINVGRSMLKRFQMDGKSLENHEVRDRLLLTF